MFPLDQLRDQIKCCTTIESRISLAVQLFKPPLKVEVQQKNAEVSKKFRDEGNHFYSRCKSAEQLLQVLEKYSRSIAFAPVDSVELSIAYANRFENNFYYTKYKKLQKFIYSFSSTKPTRKIEN